ncbi:MAG: M18 family aminopeptidase [Clostridiales bacterium]|nr:M18 family aminopeptidase [Clostridiales bacterium]
MTTKEQIATFLESSLTAYHAKDNIKATLLERGFTQLLPTQDWEISDGGKFFVERGASLIAFTIGDLDHFTYKIAAAHVDSPALKLKENPDKKTENLLTLNVEKYGGGLWYSYFDRPLAIAGQIVVKRDGRLIAETAQAPFLVSIPSQALHINRDANERFGVNMQTDVLPMYALDGEDVPFIQAAFPEKDVVSYDLFAVNTEKAYSFGKNDEFFAAPRVDNLVGVHAVLEGFLSANTERGVCVASFFNHEEIGSQTLQGAGGDFLEKTLRKIAFALRFDDNEYDKALSSSFFVSVDNAHGLHPNHPEKSDPTNKTYLGGGVVIKSHAGGAYVTDALTAATFKTVFDNAGVPYQTFFNRSDAKSGSTLGVSALAKVGMYGVDLGIAQLAMHAACECFAIKDYQALADGITAFYSSDFFAENGTVIIK